MNSVNAVIDKLEKRENVLKFISEAIQEIIDEFKMEAEKQNKKYTITNLSEYCKQPLSYCIQINTIQCEFTLNDIKQKLTTELNYNKSFIKSVILNIIEKIIY